jgi:uncharacterized membrane protein YfcA
MEIFLSNLNWWHVVVFLGAGGISGLLSGIFGIAGGTILVPLIVLIMDAVYHMPSSAGIKVAIATSLACIALSSSSTIFFQKRSGLTHFAIVRPMLPPIVIGVLSSVLIAHAVPASLLHYVFAIYLFLFFLVSFLSTSSSGPDAEIALPVFEVRGVGFGVGVLSGLLGIGGAFLTVPYLVRKGFSFRQAVGASPAVQFAVSVTGGIGYLFSGVGEYAVSPADGLVGSVHIPILIFLGLSAMTTSKFGVKVAQLMSTRSLKLGFEMFLLAISLKLFFS